MQEKKSVRSMDSGKTALDYSFLEKGECAEIGGGGIGFVYLLLEEDRSRGERIERGVGKKKTEGIPRRGFYTGKVRL